MKSIIRVALLVLCFCGGSEACADTSTPEGTLKEIVDSLKSSREPAVMLDYVDWPGAFGRISPEQRASLGAKDPAELKTVFTLMLKDPAEFIRRRLEATMPRGGDGAMVQQALTVGVQAAQDQARRMRDKIAQTDFQVGAAVRNGQGAKVPLTTTVDGVSRTTEVELELVDGRWLLSTLGLVGSEAGNHGGSGL